ncbi:DUF4926 domain-containing protein [Rugamonas rivuli]|uniref:DUF4926 domain-containing protein n=1 Tax=Rugamonas rivuli TaxID=2743358 RepID=A0A843S3F8_9BURK|nr:DUF4926 domain-containing protein [Rugamonas rivuli]MQA18805.1 DUF4926 domain-containing protein [Rugamonas rivuli]
MSNRVSLPHKMKTKFLEYDVVRSVRSLTKSVPKGTTGTVLMVFESANSRYEVEFVNRAGESLAVLTVDEKDLELIQRMM